MADVFERTVKYNM